MSTVGNYLQQAEGKTSIAASRRNSNGKGEEGGEESQTTVEWILHLLGQESSDQANGWKVYLTDVDVFCDRK